MIRNMFYLERNDKMQKKIKTTTLVSLSAVALMALNAEQASADELRAKADSPKQQQVAKAIDHKASTASDKIKPKIELKAEPKTDKSAIDSNKAKADTAKKATVSDTATDKSQDKANAKTQDAEKENKALAGQDRSSDEQYLTHGWNSTLLKAVMNSAGLTTTSEGYPVISKADAKKITSLNLCGYHIESLTGLDNLTNLWSLDLSNNQISDLTPLKGLNKLQNLNLSNNQISDLTPLKGLNDIHTLYLDNNQVSDITPLKEVTGLQELHLNNNHVSDLAPVKGLKMLHGLFLSENQISDLTPLKGLNNLAWLYLRKNDKLSDITALTNLSELNHLDLSGTLVKNLKPLENLKQLDYLKLEGTGVKDITPIANLAELRYLNLCHNRISDISPVAKLTKLQYLNLAANSNKLNDITAVANLTQLKYLNLGYWNTSNGKYLQHGDSSPKGRFKNIDALKNLKNLVYLDLNGNNIDDLEVLSNLKASVYLDLARNHIQDLKPLKDLTNIKYLYLGGNNITDMTPLENLILANTVLREPNAYGVPNRAILANLSDSVLSARLREESKYIKNHYKNVVAATDHVRVDVLYDDDDQLGVAIDFRHYKNGPTIDLSGQYINLDIDEKSKIVDLTKYIKILNYNSVIPVAYTSDNTYLNLDFSRGAATFKDLNSHGKCTADQLHDYAMRNVKIPPKFDYVLSVERANLDHDTNFLLNVSYS